MICTCEVLMFNSADQCLLTKQPGKHCVLENQTISVTGKTAVFDIFKASDTTVTAWITVSLLSFIFYDIKYQ